MKIVRNWIIASALGLCAAAHAEVTASAPSGSGTSAAPYQIASLANLRWLSENSSAWASTFVQTADIDASGTSSWNGNAGFSPIGSQTTTFTGSYNGRGHVITGLAIQRATTKYQALFGMTDPGAVIDSLGVTGASVSGYDHAAILVGYLSTGSTLKNSYVTGVVVSNSGTYTGGLVAESYGGAIANTYADATVTGGSNMSGVLVGANQASTSTLKNSYARGSVSGTTSVGGLMGANYGSVDTCYSAVAVSGTSGLGGLVGATSGGTVNASFWDTTAAGIDSSKGGTGKNTAEMNLQGTYSDWDFAHAWAVSASVNGGYPLLRSIAYAPEVATSAVSGISGMVVTVAGRLIGLGSPSVTSRGFCWNTTGSPTLSDSVIDLGAATDTGSFTAKTSVLAPFVTYCLRAFATNASGTVYGSTVSFQVMVGSGVEDAPYMVMDYSGLKLVGVGPYGLSAVYRLFADIDASPSATENSGAGFLPIGDSAVPFTGKFHGAGYKIAGLTIDRGVDSDTKVAGLFGAIGSTGVVDSLGLQGGSVSGRGHVGALAGMNSGSIHRCYATGRSIAACGVIVNIGGGPQSVSYSYAYSGGLVGTNSGRIGECFSTATDSANAKYGQNQSAYSGGLVGNNTGSIDQCYATGKASAASGHVYSGGLAGFNTGSIGHCYATGAAHSSGAVADSGGLVGSNEGTIGTSFWNAASSGVTSAYGANSGSCVAASMDANSILQSSNFGWDFSSTWFQYDGHGAPLLRAFLTPLTVTAKDSSRIEDGVAFSGGAGLSYSATVVDGLLLGAPRYGGSSQGATDTGHYTITVDSLWSTQLGYLISYKAGTLWIAAPGTDAIQTRPAHLATSHDLAANIARSFGSLAQGSGAAAIGTGIGASDAQTVDVLLPSAATVQVSIFDNLGTPVISWSRDVTSYDLANLDATGDGRWVLPVSWNGRASNDQAVPAGVYLWKITVRTEDGQKLETVKKLGVR